MAASLAVKIIAFVAVLLLAGCTSSGQHRTTEQTVVAPSSVSTANASPTEWSLATARARYLSYVTPGNANIDKFRKLAASNSTDVGQWAKLCGVLADDNDDLARKMAQGLWPAGAKEQVARFISSLAKERGKFQACQTSTTWADVQAALTDMTESSTVAEEVRVALGLPGTDS